MDVSVVIVTRNTRALTCAAVKSVFDSEGPLKKEVVVVDNGSDDGTGDTLRRAHPEASYIFSEHNLGFARGNNLGAAQCSGRFVLLLNSDARLKPDSLTRVVEFMESHPKCGVAGVQLLNPDGSNQNSIANFPTLATELLNKSLLRRLFPERYPGKERPFTDPTPVESVIGAFMMIRRETWDALNGLDARYFFFLEETDFCLRAFRSGWQVWHLPSVEVWHEQGKSAGQIPARARIEYWRSRYLYFRANHGLGTRAVLRPGLLLRLAVDWVSNGVLTVLSVGVARRARSKFRVGSLLWRWHFLGCPENMGLPR